MGVYLYFLYIFFIYYFILYKLTTVLTTNAALLIVGLIGRTFARKAKSSTFLWSAVLISVPLFTIVSRVRIDRNDQYLGHRKTLEERLDFSPLTRNAYHRALDLNRAYQEGLRQEINELELVLRK